MGVGRWASRHLPACIQLERPRRRPATKHPPLSGPWGRRGQHLGSRACRASGLVSAGAARHCRAPAWSASAQLQADTEVLTRPRETAHRPLRSVLTVIVKEGVHHLYVHLGAASPDVSPHQDEEIWVTPGLQEEENQKSSFFQDLQSPTFQRSCLF